MEKYIITIKIETLHGEEEYERALEEACRRILSGSTWGKDSNNSVGFIYEVKHKTVDLKRAEII